MTSVVIADDHPMFRVDLRVAVRGVAPSALIRQAGTMYPAREAARVDPRRTSSCWICECPGQRVAPA
jgi:DNA-binding NarL/FixJ family response regulator